MTSPHPRIDYEAELNPEQLQAVTTTEGPLLIIAGAGSGKTRVITFRMAYMLDKGIPQHSILALTFTNKAAKEMAERVRAVTQKRLRDLTVSTFHAFGVKVLRREIQLLGFKDNFSIYDEADRTQLIKDCARELGFRMEAFDAMKVGALFSDIRTQRRPWEKADDAYRQLYDEYRRSLKIFNAVDFDDLIVLPIEIFELHPEVAAAYRETFRYLMVDEFQDTSLIQYRMMRHLCQRNVCAVGDDDQSIYSWRGANYENLVRFERDFPGLVEIKLERNYRSTSTILDAANAVIANNENRKEKALWSHGGEGGTPIQFHAPEDEGAEAEFIARTIKEIRLKEKVPYGQFGVLIRTNNLTRRLEEAFLVEQLPYKVSGGTSFYGRKEIKDLISYLRVIANPDDDVNLLRIINTPRRGIGKATLERLNAIARPRNASLRTAMELVRSGVLIEASSALPGEGSQPGLGIPGAELGHGLAFGGLSERAVQDISSFLDLIEEYREELLGKKRIAAKVRQLIDSIDYWAYLVEENRQNEKAAKWKFHNLELLIQSIEEWEKDPDTMSPGLYEWLNRVALVNRDELEDEGDGKVNLMTIHAAKGLEFDVVFIAGCEDGIIPHARSLEEGEGNLEEERRLFYVAVTRARRRLFITACLRRRKQNQTVDCVPSPFLQEIPQELIAQVLAESDFTEDEGAEYFGRLNAMFAQAEPAATAEEPSATAAEPAPAED
ncbi:MAG TPA: UvrD-helicase domain-containing protein [Rectinemataceae bacterium]|nr:UvrD-helicase domain-containing protein [Rectinemataceae bacterium]